MPFIYCCSDKFSFSRNSTNVMVSSALIESNNISIHGVFPSGIFPYPGAKLIILSPTVVPWDQCFRGGQGQYFDNFRQH